MDISLLISVCSLVVALLALPASYWIAVRQVKVGLEQNDRRIKQHTRAVTADAIDEFLAVFCTSAKMIANVEPYELQSRVSDINEHIHGIEAFVVKTGVLDRLGRAIDELTMAGLDGLPEETVKRIRSIRNQISIGTDEGRFVTLGVINACGEDTQSILRRMS